MLIALDLGGCTGARDGVFPPAGVLTRAEAFVGGGRGVIDAFDARTVLVKGRAGCAAEDDKDNLDADVVSLFLSASSDDTRSSWFVDSDSGCCDSLRRLPCASYA